ncbi:MAG TPA: hypothetical protein VFY87_20190, partial [Geminicoccaceae bacterium]|nr:hypothetical protein [Geminicoccaceae bacterium]
RDGLLDTDEADRTNELSPPSSEAAPANDDPGRRDPPPPTEATPRERTDEPTGFRHGMPPLPPTFVAAPAETTPPARPLPAPANRTDEFPRQTASTAPAHRSDLRPVPAAPAVVRENRL